ncbi:MAG: sugar phosphate isomerase/epimerase [Bryobacterales bacterium]|nr:sugar phosphate isomerase/epimerase [Bryobacterales bacterium]
MNRRTWLHVAGAGAAAYAVPVRAAIETAGGKSRLRSAICAYSFREQLQKKTMSYEDLVKLAVDLNVDGLDLTVYWFPSTEDSFLLPLRRLAYRSGVELYSISVRSDLCKGNVGDQQSEFERLMGWIDAASKLGAGHIRVFGGNVPKGATEDQAAEWVATILSRAAEYAGKKGIILGLENHGGITARAERIIQIVKKVDSPWVGINLDTGNFHEQEPYAEIQKCVPYAVNVQVKEKIRAGGALVDSDWARIVGMLRTAGYKGYLALEYEEKTPAPQAVPGLIGKLKKVIA